jgi:IS30 family transposase
VKPKTCLLATHVKLRTIVASKLILDWSPEQISGWLKIPYVSVFSIWVGDASSDSLAAFSSEAIVNFKPH